MKRLIKLYEKLYILHVIMVSILALLIFLSMLYCNNMH